MIFLFYLIFSILTNMLNPVTPALFLELNMPDYMFGVGFACMAIATFIFSPIWGKTCRKIGCVNVFVLGFLLYGCTQILFSISTTQIPILFCRFFGGVAYSAGVVASMSCLMDIAEEDEKYNFMLYHSAITTVGVALGYSLGGIVGSVSVDTVFRVQIITLFALIFCTKISLKESMFPKVEQETAGSKEAGHGRTPMSKKAMLFLGIVFLSSFATTSYDTAFTYYIKAALDFPNYWTGLVRGGIGIIALVVDFTIGIWIIKSRKARKKSSMFLHCVLLQPLLHHRLKSYGCLLLPTLYFLLLTPCIYRYSRHLPQTPEGKTIQALQEDLQQCCLQEKLQVLYLKAPSIPTEISCRFWQQELYF